MPVFWTIYFILGLCVSK